MLDKTRLGNRYTCYECGTKFYDLNRPAPICPECQADQTNAPVQDVKALLSKGGGRKSNRKQDSDDDAPPQVDEDLEDSDDDDDGELGLGLGDDDDDDDDDDLG